MPKPNIVVLRVRRGNDFLEARRATGTNGRGDKIEIEIVDAEDRSKVEADPTTLVYADEMPITQIKPFRTAEGEVADETISTWGVKAVKADVSPFNGSGSTVAILDSGIDLEHPAFAPIKHRIEVQDFTGAGIQDNDGHGTHCAGTIFGQDIRLGESTLRIGVARDVKKAYVGKIFGGDDNEVAINICRIAPVVGSLALFVEYHVRVLLCLRSRSIEHKTGITYKLSNA